MDLRKKVEYKGVEYQELNMDLESLTGTDMIKANAKLRKAGVDIDDLMPVLNMEYQVLLAAKAANVPKEVIEKMDARDFLEITMEVQSFLLDTASKKKQKEESEKQ